MTEQPELPYYDGSESSSGHAGSDTSHERATHDDTTGVTATRQDLALTFLGLFGAYGATSHEFGDRYGLHHGQSSGVLSTLHKTGKVARLTKRRNRCEVYVLPEYVQGQETKPHGSISTTQMLDEMYDLLNDATWHVNTNEWQARAHDVMRRYESRKGNG